MNGRPAISTSRRTRRLATYAAALAIAALGIVPAVGQAKAPSPAWQRHARPSGGPTAEEARARVIYSRLWLRTAPLLGAAGRAAPRLRFVDASAPKPDPDAVMWVGPDESGHRTIFITPGQRRLLAKRGGDWRNHYAALTHALHETAHVFQTDEVLRDASLREQGACQWAKAHAPQILGTARRKAAVPYDAWRDRDQFGRNFGQDPTTFGWPDWFNGGGPPPTGGVPPASTAPPAASLPGILNQLGL
jgi:hypothetical protein